MVLHPYLKGEQQLRSPEGRLEEAVGLALAIELEVLEKLCIPLSSTRPSTLLGSGKMDEIGQIITAQEIGLVIVDAKLSPVQQRNLEKAWQCKVIDRTALILEIFGARARTNEGKLQVELASLNYQKSRLVRSWTHLERQRGGFGFLGGPGESQIETDRRLIRDRITRLKRELETVVRTRELHRKNRREVPYPLIALVGYTNAGKSTLFNRLTGAGVEAVDKLFATLDPTIRALRLPSGTLVMLSDTVGFVSDLPHDLVAAFRATLEEVLEADIILHVRDISHPDSEAQKQDVEQVLAELFAAEPEDDASTANRIEVWNKCDLIDETALPAATHMDAAQPPLAVSALTGTGITQLQQLLDTLVSDGFYITADYTLSAAQGKEIAWLFSHGSVLSQTPDESNIHFRVRLSAENISRFNKMMGIATPIESDA